ncbi:MAG: PspC domain-containing protein [Candidatus Diapherotrites archaeon]
MAKKRKSAFEQRLSDFGNEVEALGKKAGKAIESLDRENGNSKPKRLYRSGKERVLGGVCGGFAEYFKIDPIIVRLLWVLLALAGGTGILLYIIAWILIPRNPRDKWD